MKKKILSLATASIVFLSSTSMVFADYNFSLPVYKKSMYHKDVEAIQSVMIKEGLLNIKSPTTYYGPLTEGAVLSFQKKYGLYRDGIAGKNTLAKINSLGTLDNSGSTYSFNFSKSVYKLGERHNDVSQIQSALKKDGTFNYPSITTYYGPVTRQAVIDFQKKYGLYADGIVGKNTIAKMTSLGLFGAGTFSANRSSTSRETVGEYLDWWSDAQYVVPWHATFEVVDLYTNKSFMAKRTGGSNHADVETLTTTDTNIVKEIWGGNFSWTRRPVLVKINGRTIAASATGMPHAGNDNAPSREYTTWRSNGYGSGTNYDSVKNNGMHGHIDIHFKNSTRHKDGKIDSNHQEAVKKAAGLK